MPEQSQGIRDIGFVVGRIEGIVEALPDRMARFEDATTNSLEELKRLQRLQNGRVGKLERGQAVVAGAAATVGTILGAAGAAIVSWFRGT